MSTKEEDKNHHKSMLTNRRSLLLVMFLFMIMMTNSVINCKPSVVRNVGDNLLVTKNNKIVQLAYNNALVKNQQQQQQQQQHYQQSIIRISNNQQTFTIQLLSSQNSNTNIFLSTHMPILSTLVLDKGYIRPLQQQLISSTIKSSTSQHKQYNQQTTKGYRYFKQSASTSSISLSTKHEQISNEINHLLRLLIKQNDLTFLSMRLQDSFQIQFGINVVDGNDGKGVTNNNNSSSITKLISIEISYLFPTVQQSAIPQHIFSTLQIRTQQQQSQSQQNIITLQRRLSGKGLHQVINFTLILNDKIDIQFQSLISQKQCIFKFTDILPQSIYIDVDQNRQSVQNYQVINIQKPAFDSKQYYYQFTISYSQFKQVGVNKYQYQQLIHFRYPQPSLLNYTKVYLHPIQQAMIVCYDKNINSNKQQQLASATTIYQVEENVLFDRGTAKIPNADISKQKIVSIITLAVCLVTVLMIVSRLKKF